jgi:hypothetical protein
VLRAVWVAERSGRAIDTEEVRRLELEQAPKTIQAGSLHRLDDAGRPRSTVVGASEPRRYI